MSSFDFLRPALLAAGLSVALGVQAERVEAPDAAKVAEQVQWKIWGGEASFRWNRTLLVDHGIEVSSAIGGSAPDDYARERLGIRGDTALDFSVDKGTFTGFIRGSLGFAGGFDLKTPGGVISLRDARLVPRAGEPYLLDLVSADGVAWFYIDRLMYEIEGGAKAPVLAIPTSDLRIGDVLAAHLGEPRLAGVAVADVAMVSAIHSDNGDPKVFEPTRGSGKWPGSAVPGVPGAVYEADVFMHHFSSGVMRRCAGQLGDACGTVEKIALAPSSTLRNNRSDGLAQVSVPCVTPSCSFAFPPPTGMVTDPLGTSSALYAADVAWHQSFTGNFAPYGNDQHPYLIWNLYRIDADGRIEQIGRSGVKHAFLTTNNACDANPGTGHILGRGCGDTYSTGNNDSISYLGPRNEIIPAKGLWGRCGSVFDVNCDGLRDSQSPCSNLPGGNTPTCQNWAYRLDVPVAQINPNMNEDAIYWMESWYVVRDDINIYNTMQTRPLTFIPSGSTWLTVDGAGSELKLGPAIDRWLARGTNTSTERSSDIETAYGHARLAMKAVPLDGGGWRYDYVVANFDFAVAQTTGAEPNLRVVSNTGFTRFELDAAGSPALDTDQFSDGDQDAGNDWTFSQTGASVRWTPPGGDVGAATANALNWGTMYRFSFESDAAPVAGVARLNAPDGVVLTVPTLVPQGAEEPVLPLFEDGFEGDAPEA